MTNKNNQRLMTYEELMNSSFLRNPNHSKVVHAIFNPFVVAAIIFIVTTSYVKIADGEWDFALITGFLTATYLSMRILTGLMQINGHDVGLRKKSKLSVLGLSNVAVIMLSIILFCIITIIIVSHIGIQKGELEGFKRAQMLGISLLFAFVMSLLSWRFHTYYETRYGSEYDAKMEFKRKGYSDEKIELKIKQLKKQGVLF